MPKKGDLGRFAGGGVLGKKEVVVFLRGTGDTPIHAMKLLETTPIKIIKSKIFKTN